MRRSEPFVATVKMTKPPTVASQRPNAIRPAGTDAGDCPGVADALSTADSAPADGAENPDDGGEEAAIAVVVLAPGLAAQAPTSPHARSNASPRGIAWVVLIVHSYWSPMIAGSRMLARIGAATAVRRSSSTGSVASMLITSMWRSVALPMVAR